MGVRIGKSAARAPGSAVLRAAVADQRRTIGAATAFIVAWQVCEALVPVLIGAIIDRAILPGDGRAMVFGAGALCLLFAVLSFSFRAGSRRAVRAREDCANRTREQLTRRVLHSGALSDNTSRPGVAASIIGEDADRVAGFIALVPFACGAAASVAVAAVMLLNISVPLGLVVLLGCPLLLVLVHRAGAPLERRSAHEQELAAQAASVATDLVSGLRVLKGIGGEDAAAQRYLSASRTSLRVTLSAARAQAAYDSLARGATMSFLALVVLAGAYPAINGRIGVGELISAVGLAVFLLGPLARLAHTGAGLARARASAARVSMLRDAPVRPAGDVTLVKRLTGRLDVKSGPVSFTAAPGELLGIVADPRDAARLMHEVTTGAFTGTADVAVDGVRVCDLDHESARAALLVVRHHEALFTAPLWDNVQAAGADEVRVVQALAASDADQVAQTLRDGVNTVLSGAGSALSGGQRQRVVLARALAADPAVLVLHDPTTAVDSATDARIAAGLREARAGRTTVLITSDPILLDVCDRVLLLRNGAVHDWGTHSMLAASQELYRELVLA